MNSRYDRSIVYIILSETRSGLFQHILATPGDIYTRAIDSQTLSDHPTNPSATTGDESNAPTHAEEVFETKRVWYAHICDRVGRVTEKTTSG